MFNFTDDSISFGNLSIYFIMLILKTIVDLGSSPPGMFYNEYAANLQENIHVLQHGCSLVYLLHIFRLTFPKNTSAGLLL